MTTLLFTRRYLLDYARNPINLVLLAVVPIVFVVVVAGSLADWAKLLGSTGGPAVETAAAGWAAAFLAGIAMYFQTAETRETDRRVVIAGLAANRLVLARLLTGLILAVMASAAALLALTVRIGLTHPIRAVVGTLMFAVIYVALGSVIGSIARNPVNGTVIVLFVWIVDVFFGPAMGAADQLGTRWLPTHFVTLWMVDLPSGHGGRFGDLGFALAWTVGAALTAWVLVAARTRLVPARRATSAPGSVPSQVAAAGRASWRDARRNPAQWALFVVVPVVFILGAVAVTPNTPMTVALREHGRRVALAVAGPQLHGATMAPIAISTLAALIGLFVLLDSRAADTRAALAGMRPQALFTARVGVLAGLTVGAAIVSLATTAFVFDAARWPTYIAANILIGLTYAMIGALLAPIFGRVGGVFLAFLLPFLDLGIVQSPMLHPTPTSVSRFLPGYGGMQVLLDGGLTRSFDEALPLLLALGWLATLTLAVALLYQHTVRARGDVLTLRLANTLTPSLDATATPDIDPVVVAPSGQRPLGASAGQNFPERMARKDVGPAQRRSSASPR
jgi:hypothetical protein